MFTPATQNHSECSRKVPRPSVNSTVPFQNGMVGAAILEHSGTVLNHNVNGTVLEPIVSEEALTVASFFFSPDT